MRQLKMDKLDIIEAGAKLYLGNAIGSRDIPDLLGLQSWHRS
jgi:hypothetical protein